MAPMLWEILYITITRTSQKDWFTLLQPHSGILPFVRRLLVKHLNVYGDNQKVAATNLMFLLCALPRNRLIEFNTNFELSELQFQLLIQNHQGLKRFRSLLEDSERLATGRLDQASWMAPYLSKMEELELWLPLSRNDEIINRSHRNLRFIIGNSGRLLHLNLRSLNSRVKDGVPRFAAHILGNSPLTHLTTLTLNNINLSQPNYLLDRICILNLQKLQLLHCKTICPFLEAVSEVFCSGPSQLQHLDICIDLKAPVHQADAVVQTVERLLSLCVGLKTIGLDTGHGRLPDKDSIIRHGASLRSLCLTNFLDANASYPVEDLARIIRSCRELEDLGLPICPTDLGHIKDMGVGFTLHTAVSTFPRTEFEATLVSYEIETRNFCRIIAN